MSSTKREFVRTLRACLALVGEQRGQSAGRFAVNVYRADGALCLELRDYWSRDPEPVLVFDERNLLTDGDEPDIDIAPPQP